MRYGLKFDALAASVTESENMMTDDGPMDFMSQVTYVLDDIMS